MFSQTILPWWLNDIVILASIISLGVSLYVAIQVRLITRYYQRLVLVPKIRTELRSHYRSLIKCKSSRDQEELQRTCASIRALLTELQPISSGESRRSAESSLLIAIEILEDDPQKFSAIPFARLVVAMIQLETHLTYLIEVTKWR